MSKYLMSIDAGTGSIRVIIFDTKGNQLAVGQKEWIHKEEKGVPQSMEFDFRTNWGLVAWCIQEAIKKAKIKSNQIVAISASSMREAIVVYDKTGKELWAVANVDARAFKQVKQLKKKYKDIEKRFYATSGQTFALGALPRLLWLKQNRKDIYNKVAKVSMISDWVLFKLSGKLATDPSNGGTSGIFSLKKRQWQPEMAKEVGIKSNIFPQVMQSGEVLGYVDTNVAKQTKLSTKTVVVVGGGDVQVGCVGLGVVKANQVAVLGGSFWQQIVNIPKEAKLDSSMQLRVNPHTISSLSQLEGITFFSGLVMRWFRDSFCQNEIKEAKKKNIDVYSLLEKKASKVPVGSYGILPIFSHDMRYAKWYHASPSFLNLSLDSTKCNKASMFRSLQENACIVSSINLKKIEKLTKNKIDTIIFASGASKGELWCQILADVTNCTIKVPKVKEATSLGCAILAGYGAKIYNNIATTSSKLVQWDKTYKPNKANHKIYKKIAKKWQKAYKAQLKLVDKKVTKSMWKATGL